MNDEKMSDDAATRHRHKRFGHGPFRRGGLRDPRRVPVRHIIYPEDDVLMEAQLVEILGAERAAKLLKVFKARDEPAGA